MSEWYASVERFVVDLPEGAEGGAPEPKWWYFRLLNCLFAAVFLLATAYHVYGLDAPGGRAARGGAGVLPVLLVWSCCMAYFFGFFGLGFVDAEADLDLFADEDLCDDPTCPADSDEAALDESKGFFDEAAVSGPPQRTARRRLASVAESDDDDDAGTGAARTGSGPVRHATDRAPEAAQWRRRDSSAGQQPRTLEIGQMPRTLEIGQMPRTLEIRQMTTTLLVLGHALIDGLESEVVLGGPEAAMHSAAIRRGGKALRLSGGVRTSLQRSGTRQSPSSGAPACVACVCVVAPSAAKAELLLEASSAVAQKPLLDAEAVGRCIYLTASYDSDEATALTAIEALGTEVAAHQDESFIGLAWCEAAFDASDSVCASATIPGPVSRRCLGVCAADLVSALGRREAAESSAKARHSQALRPWANLASRRRAQTLSGLALAHGLPLSTSSDVSDCVDVAESESASRQTRLSNAITESCVTEARCTPGGSFRRERRVLAEEDPRGQWPQVPPRRSASRPSIPAETCASFGPREAPGARRRHVSVPRPRERAVGTFPCRFRKS